MENLNLYPKAWVALRNRSTQQYFRFTESSQDPFRTADAFGTPPSINANPEKSDSPQTQIQIVLTSGDEKSPLTFGSKVYLVTNTNHYLACLADGGLKFDKLGLDEGMNKTLKTTSTWVLTDSNNSLMKKPLSVYDDVVLRSVYSTFLFCEEEREGFVTTRANVASTPAVWNIMKANVPFIPDWMYNRPAMSKRLTTTHDNQPIKRDEKKLLSSFSKPVQEWLLIEDLLDVMLGFEGVYIKRRAEKTTFVIEPQLESPSCDPVLYSICQKLLVMPLHYLYIENYLTTSSIQNGTVAQAFCGALRLLLKEYKLGIIQLDEEVTNGLTLQKMYYFLRPVAAIVEAIFDLAKAAQGLRGGPLLSCIESRMNSTTDTQTFSTYKFLFDQCITVYIEQLQNWIYSGVVFDKQNEFMIQKKQLQKDRKVNEWNQKFVIIEDMVPLFLKKEKEFILKTGKYLNVVSACKKHLNHPFKFELSRNLQRYLKDNDFSEPIHKAYRWVSEELRNFIFIDQSLIPVLTSLKGYFLLEFGDLFANFLEAAETYLSEPRSKNISTEKLSSLWDLSLKTSTAKNDLLNDDAFCRIQTLTIFEQMNSIKKLEPQKFQFDPTYKPPGQNPHFKYFQAFALDLKISFPLNLIINFRSLSKYQVLFRHLFWFKYIEKYLYDYWAILQSVKQYEIKSLKSAHLLVQRMIQYVKSMMYYFFYEVVERNWTLFLDKLKKIETFEEIIAYHDQFLDSCLKESLITNEKLLKIMVSDIGNSIQGMVALRKYISNLTSTESVDILDKDFDVQPVKLQKQPSRRQKIQQTKIHINKLMQTNKFNHTVEGYILNFDKGMKQLLEDIYRLIGKDNAHLVHLLARLDTHEFYAQRLEILRTNGDRM